MIRAGLLYSETEAFTALDKATEYIKSEDEFLSDENDLLRVPARQGKFTGKMGRNCSQVASKKVGKNSV